MDQIKSKMERTAFSSSDLNKNLKGKPGLEWLGEENNLGISLKFLGSRLREIKSDLFRVVIFKGFTGVTLSIEEKGETTLQSSEKFDYYDEVLANVPANSHPEPKKVLVVGGGDGKIASQLVKYGVEEITVVDLSREVFKATKDYFWSEEALEITEVVFEPAQHFLEKSDEKFDLVIGDFTDPYPGSAAEALISKEFMENVRRSLNKGGIFAFQSGSPIFQPEIVRKAFRNARSVFKSCRVFWAPVPIYPLALWTFVIASTEIKEFKPLRKMELEFYSSDIHEALFTLPPLVKRLIEE